jgi:hypothetical protein
MIFKGVKEKSLCYVKDYGTPPNPEILRIVLTGELGRLPSVANTHRVFRGRVCSSKDTQDRLEALNASYMWAAKKSLGYLPNYGDEKLVLYFDLGNQNKRMDIDNTLKGAIDWLVVHGGMKDNDKGVWAIPRPSWWYGGGIDFTVITVRKFKSVGGTIDSAWSKLNPRAFENFLTGTGANSGDDPKSGGRIIKPKG